jgi:hypothetical protein
MASGCGDIGYHGFAVDGILAYNARAQDREEQPCDCQVSETKGGKGKNGSGEANLDPLKVEEAER